MPCHRVVDQSCQINLSLPYPHSLTLLLDSYSLSRPLLLSYSHSLYLHQLHYTTQHTQYTHCSPMSLSILISRVVDDRPHHDLLPTVEPTMPPLLADQATEDFPLTVGTYLAAGGAAMRTPPTLKNPVSAGYLSWEGPQINSGLIHNHTTIITTIY